VITGAVSDDGVPRITLRLADGDWPAVIDTGFNGDLELPQALQQTLQAQPVGHVTSLLAAGQSIEEDVYLVEITFDGRRVRAEATFVPGAEILIGTRLLKTHRLEVDFPGRRVTIEEPRD
jgi:clan AA aspartic protease